jgi:hydrogenase maturation protein HypF
MAKGRQIRVQGQVQGVGLRPFVWQLAQQMGLRGHVLNDPEGVLIIAVGPDLDGFEAALQTQAPALARVDALHSAAWDGPVGKGFTIAASEGRGAKTRVPPDAATCPDCLAEILAPDQRRHGYAFANCTNCGPRYSILRGLPYDRAQTSMAGFEMCEACRAEYEDPSDRRFHAQPIACAACGPKLWTWPQSDAPIQAAARALLEGKVVAIKGLGGFHLAVDATQDPAVQLLRDRKRRPSKPFALMGTAPMIAQYCTPSAAEWDLLQDPAAPIVLMRGQGLPGAVAPHHDRLGWMLPYTPLHHLLLAAVDRPLVMTSGNLSGEPQVIGNDEALEKLAPFADLFVLHDRDIARRLDDSVERVEPPMNLRRARGRVPGTLPLPPGLENAPQIAAYGGQMKAAICLIKNGQALLGHHLGELDDALTYDAFLQADADYADLFDHQPALVACDMHPDFRASQHARSKGLPVIEVQHHHAHLAACLGENQWPLDGGKVAGIVLDGLGLGPDGTVWGGEILVGDYRGFERAAWLKPAPLIGGDMASRQPWRNALARLDQAGLADWADAVCAAQPLAAARMVAARGVNAPMSSSAGRLFDAVAAVLGICPEAQSYEGEAAMRLEALAEPDACTWSFAEEGGVLDPAPVFRAMRQAVSQGRSAGWCAGQFHAALASAFAARARQLWARQDIRAVALSGGCFQNATLLQQTLAQLGDIPVLLHTKVPANDGGLALGQALIAAATRV